MSQSPLSRAIRELERELGLVLFVRTTRRVELTPAGSALLERSRRALAEIDGAVADACRAAQPDGGVLGIGYGPFSRSVVTRIPHELERESPGLSARAWLRTVFRAEGLELERTLETLSAPWDRRMLPVANGEAVCVLVADWVEESIAGVVAVPFDPPLSFPTDLASCWPPSDGAKSLVEAALRVRDAEGWLTRRPARVELPGD